MKGLVGGPLLVGGLGPRPPGPPLNPALMTRPLAIVGFFDCRLTLTLCSDMIVGTYWPKTHFNCK